MDRELFTYNLKQFEMARRDLLSVVIFTTINLALQIVNQSLYFFFSAIAPLYALIKGQALAHNDPSSFYFLVGLVIALIITLAYFACWYFGKQQRIFIPIAFVIFIIDSLFLVYLCATYGFESTNIIEIAFHLWVTYSLFGGTLAWYKLKDFSEVEIAQMHNVAFNVIIPVVTEPLDVDVPTIKNSIALRPDDKKGRILITADYQGMKISVKRSRALSELIIDGQVYDEIYGTFETNYRLRAIVKDYEIIGELKALTLSMYIYVNGEKIKTKLRFY